MRGIGKVELKAMRGMFFCLFFFFEEEEEEVKRSDVRYVMKKKSEKENLEG